jgi:putative ATP-binding cassette transporter
MNAGQSITIPGYLVWCALVFTALRFATVRINEHADGIALRGGEEDERRQLAKLIDGVVVITAISPMVSSG